MFGLYVRRNMAHNSSNPNCFWVLRFPFSSSFILHKPKKPIETTFSSLLLFSFLYLFVAFLSSCRSICSLLVPNRLISSFYRNRQISLNYIDFSSFHWLQVNSRDLLIGYLQAKMQAYEDEYDEGAGYDDYYSGGEDEYEDEDDEDERPPPKEELEYLELRQKLKDKMRKNMGKGSASTQSSQDRRRKLPYNDFGSFFGPSRPVISSRVIQESKSLLENEIRTARTANANQVKKRPVSTSGLGIKNVPNENRRPKVVNEVRRKVEALKDTRDYSFLFSDDAELPVPKKETLSRSGSFPNSEARSAQLSARPKQLSGINGRTPQGPLREEKRPVSTNGHSRPSSSGSQMNHSRPSQMQNSRPASSGSQMNQSRPVAGRPASSGSQMQNSRPTSSGSQMQQRAVSASSQRPVPSSNRQAPMRPPGSTMNSQSVNRNGQLNSRPDSQRSAPAKMAVDHRKQMSSSNGSGPSRSASMARPLPSKAPLDRKPSFSSVGKTSLQSAQRPSSSRPMASDPRRRVVEQSKVSRDLSTSRMIPKQSTPTSKHQMMSRPVPKRPPPRYVEDDRRPLKKKKPAVRSEDDEAFDIIRKMFNTKRYAAYDDDDDDRNMEANFEDIQKEERRSARIAREEDEREALLIEQEEKRERERRNRKMSR